MTLPPVLATTWVIIEYLIKVAVLGTVPENRRPSSSTAQLLFISPLPLVRLPLYLLIGSPWVYGTCRRQQHTVSETTLGYTRSMPDSFKGARPSTYLAGALRMNCRLTGLPCVSDEVVAVHADLRSTYEVMARAIDFATDHTHVEFYIMSWDEVTDVFLAALECAVARGVTMCLLLGHLGSRKYPGWKQFCQRMTDTGIHRCLMMPLLPFKCHQRRPDLRNYRKILVTDGERGLIGSHDVTDSSYRTRRNVRAGRCWEGLPVEVTGEIVLEAQVVFAMDQLFEVGEQPGVFGLALGAPTEILPEMAGLPGIPMDTPAPRPGRSGAVVDVMQLVPSGSGYPTESNLRIFLALIHGVKRHVSIISPYFISNEALLAVMTLTAYRGAEVELFVGKELDQFTVSHAQCFYYSVPLAAGARIYLYLSPIALHSKYMMADDEVGVIGSPNVDLRFFALNYEVMPLVFEGDLDDLLRNNDTAYRTTCTELTPELWATESWYNRYVGNVCRLTSAVLQRGRGWTLRRAKHRDKMCRRLYHGA